ncbi:Hypothetical protein D9617_9g023180 [Elsinoe fawcettii]|nr:Hypothetical protein D9617_9g023180 [Elsinoe fawcettii]
MHFLRLSCLGALVASAAAHADCSILRFATDIQPYDGAAPTIIAVNARIAAAKKKSSTTTTKKKGKRTTTTTTTTKKKKSKKTSTTTTTTKKKGKKSSSTTTTSFKKGKPNTASSTATTRANQSKPASTTASVKGPQTTPASATTTSPRVAGTPAVFATAPFPSNMRSYNFANAPNYTSDHFMVWNATTSSSAATYLNILEGVYDCFVNTLGWKNPGVPFFDDPAYGPFYKTNFFVTPKKPNPNVAGTTTGDTVTGLGFVFLQPSEDAYTGVASHEFGHVMTFAQQQWWNQSRPMGWSETIAQYVMQAWQQNPVCASSRAKFNYTATPVYLWYPKYYMTNSWNTLINSAAMSNEYQAWPWLLYLSDNLDNYPTLGNSTMLKLFQEYKVNSEETPFHTLNRVAAPYTSQQLVARYWARNAFVDLGVDYWQYVWNVTRDRLEYNNTVPKSDGVWQVAASKRPLYMGSNIIPLNSTGNGDISIQVNGAGVFTSTLAIRSIDNTVQYIVLSNTTAAQGSVFSQKTSISLNKTQEAMLVVANTPDRLLLYDTYDISGAVAVGLDYSITLTGAVPLTSLEPATPACATSGEGCLPVPIF